MPKNFIILSLIRGTVAYQLAKQFRAYYRWIPSELNTSDYGSRIYDSSNTRDKSRLQELSAGVHSTISEPDVAAATVDLPCDSLRTQCTTRMLIDEPHVIAPSIRLRAHCWNMLSPPPPPDQVWRVTCERIRNPVRVRHHGAEVVVASDIAPNYASRQGEGCVRESNTVYNKSDS